METNSLFTEHKTAPDSRILDPVDLCTSPALAIESTLQSTVFTVTTAAVLGPTAQAQPGIFFVIIGLRKGFVHAVGILCRRNGTLVPVVKLRME